MSVVEKLNDRIRSKITPELSARITAMRSREHGIEVATQVDAHKAQFEETAPGMRM